MNDVSRTNPSRRRFLTTSAGVLAGVGVTTSASAGQGDEYGGFTVGVQSYCFREFNLEQTLKQTKELGIRYVEFSDRHLKTNSTPDQIKSFLNLCGEYDITPNAFGVQAFSNNHDANRRLFDFAKALGIKYLSADPAPDSFDSLDKLCEEYQVAIAIHPHGPVGKDKLHRWYAAEVILPAVKDRHPLIGTCIDTGHIIRCAQLGKPLDPVAQVRLMGARNFGLHLKDHDNQRKTDVVIGEGALDVPGLVQALRAVQFKGFISLEHEANPQNPKPDMAASLAVLRSAIKKER